MESNHSDDVLHVMKISLADYNPYVGFDRASHVSFCSFIKRITTLQSNPLHN